MPKLQVTVGLPASGKTSWALGQLKKDKNTVAFSYDDFRMMCFNDSQNGIKGEELVRRICKISVTKALEAGFNVIVHNTSLTETARKQWEMLVLEFNGHCDTIKNYAPQKTTLEFMDFTKVTVDTCIGRDNLRQGRERVSPPVIWNMALQAGLLKNYFDPSKKIVIVDVDGTLADHEGVRGPYDEAKVHLDKPYEIIVKWVRNLVHSSGYCGNCNKSACYDAQMIVKNSDSEEQAGYNFPEYCGEGFIVPEYQVIVVSGRSTECALSTYLWLSSRITFSALFMRNRGDHRPDVEVKQDILNTLLKTVPKEQIAFVIDDRPKVIKMWRDNGLTVYPARGAVEDF